MFSILTIPLLSTIYFLKIYFIHLFFLGIIGIIKIFMNLKIVYIGIINGIHLNIFFNIVLLYFFFINIKFIIIIIINVFKIIIFIWGCIGYFIVIYIFLEILFLKNLFKYLNFTLYLFFIDIDFIIWIHIFLISLNYIKYLLRTGLIKKVKILGNKIKIITGIIYIFKEIIGNKNMGNMGIGITTMFLNVFLNILG